MAQVAVPRNSTSILQNPIGQGVSGCVYLNVNIDSLSCLSVHGKRVPTNLRTNNVVKVLSYRNAIIEHNFSKIIQRIDPGENFSINNSFLCYITGNIYKTRLFSERQCLANIQEPALLIYTNGGETLMSYLQKKFQPGQIRQTNLQISNIFKGLEKILNSLI